MAPRHDDWRNAAINMDEFGGSRPALKADTIKPSTATVITVTDVEKLEVNDSDSESGKRVAIVLQSAEYPDRGFWLNKSGIKTLMEHIGPRPASWIGQQIPLVVVRVNNPKTNTVQQALQVATPAEWDEVLEGFASATGAKRTRRTASAPAKRTAKKAAKKTRTR